MCAAISNTFFWEQFLRNIGLAIVNDLVAHIRNGVSQVEKKKIVINRSLTLALARCSVHIIPVLVSITLLIVNTKQVFIGIDFNSNIKSVTVNLALLQTAAKLQELLIVASLATVAFQLLRHELIHGDGLPLGLLAAGFDFTRLSYFWSPEMLGAFRNAFSRPSKVRHIALVLFLVTAGVLAALVGPSCAVLLIPQPQDWPAGGTLLYLNGTQDHIWPATISAVNSSFKDLCTSVDATENGVCPSGGYYSLWAHYARLNTQTYQDVVPAYARLLSGNNYYWSLESSPPVPIRAIPLGILGNADATFIQARYSVAIILDQLMRDWWTILRSKRAIRDDNVENRAAAAHLLSPMTNIRCSDAQNLSRLDRSILFPVPGSPASFKQQTPSQLASEPSRHLRFSWVRLPEFADTISTGAVFQSPWTSDNRSRIAIGCTVQARWVPAQIHTDAYSFWQGWYPKNISFEAAYPSAGHTLLSGLPNARDAIAVDEDWLSTLTPAVGKGRPGYQDWQPTTIEGILSSAHLTDGLFNTDEHHPIDMWQTERSKLLTSIIGSVFTDGLARLGIEEAFDQTGPPSTWWPSGFVKADDFDNAILTDTKAVQRPTTGNTTELAVKFSISGLSYRLTIVQKLAMVVLLLHILIALAHVGWILSRGESSGCWDSVIELLVLAQNSKPAMTALANTAAGIKYSATFAKHVNIRSTGENHLEMVFEEGEEAVTDSEMVDLDRNSTHSDRRISHPSTWPLRRQGTRTPSSGSAEYFPDADLTPSTPLIDAAARHEPARVEVGKAYG
ncbi:MAG: hypothetical protein L6R40_006726 [Gallowayella cf. fulva]|nr:MAG: hypothetical protein L6R40_006726 [Xanthomendoza cf. fulva]